MQKTLVATLCEIGQPKWSKSKCCYFPLKLKVGREEFKVIAWDRSMTDLKYVEEGDYIQTNVEDSSFIDKGKVHIEYKTRDGITRLEDSSIEPGLKLLNKQGILTCLDIHEASSPGHETIAVDCEETLKVREAYYKSDLTSRKALRTYIRIPQNHPALQWLKIGDKIEFSGFVDPARTDRIYVTKLIELRRI